MIEQLQLVPIFAGLDDDALRLLVERSSPAEFLAGHVIVREGALGNRLFLINTGMVRVSKNFGTPEQVQLALLKPGDHFGEMCILEPMPRSATVQAVTDTKLSGLSAMVFLELYEKMPKQYGLLLLNIARDLSRRLRQLDKAFAARH